MSGEHQNALNETIIDWLPWWMEGLFGVQGRWLGKQLRFELLFEL
jgi:hypothetical protein